MKGGWQSATRPSESVTASAPWGWGTVVVVVGNGGVVPVVVMVDVGWVVGVVVGCGAVVVGVLAGVVADGTADPKKLEEPKSKTPPSEATKRYPVPGPPASIPTIGLLRAMLPVEPRNGACHRMRRARRRPQ